jgi:hypothetical protein
MSWPGKILNNKDCVACLAVSNLFFIHLWRTLLVPAWQYHLGILPGPLDFAIVLANILAVSLLMYGCLALARCYMGNFGANVAIVTYLFLLLLLSVTAYHPEISDSVFGIAHPNRTKIAVVLAISGLTPLAVRKWPAVLRRTFHLVGLSLLPCFFFTVLRSAESFVVRGVQSGSTVGSSAGENPAQKPARTALIVFDMLDYELLFEHKPSDVQIPEFDKLRYESLFAEKATTASQWTLTAIPTITTGKIVTEAQPISPDDLLLTFEGLPEKKGWKHQPTIFSEARDAGMATGVVGWYHPYCRLFGAMLASCEWVPFPEKFEDRGSTPLGVERAVIEVITDDLFASSPPPVADRILEVNKNMRRKYIDSYHRLLAAAMYALTNPALDFVVVHMPVPHTPSIYNRSTQQFSEENGDYLDNVALADRTLGALRREMEHAGLWDTTNILVTADHGFRDAGKSEWKHTPTPYHVPFFLKMSGFDRAIEDEQPFNTVRIHDLLLALLQRQVATPEQAKECLHAAPPLQCHAPKQTD